MDHRNIIVAGDSIARGYADAVGHYAWPTMIAPKIAAHLNTNIGVVNLSVGGATSLAVAEHFKAVAKDIESPAAIIFAFGANDIKRVPHRDGSLMIDPLSRDGIWQDVFRYAADRHHGVPIFAVSVMPVDQAYYDDPDNGLTVHRSNTDIDIYNCDMELICRERDVRFIDANGMIDRNAWVKRLVDGVHPDGIGQGLLAEAIFEGMYPYL